MRERPLRVGIQVTHPVQYFAPLFREIANDPRLDLTVFYAHQPSAVEQGVGFNVPFEWDIDLLGGHRSVFLKNRARRPGVGFFGFNTPEIAHRIRRGGFDAFLVSGWHALTYWQAIQACWASGVPVLVRGDSQLADPRHPATRWTKEAVYPLFVRRFASCIAVGQRSADYFRHFGARRIDLVPHFVDNERFATQAAGSATAALELRDRYGIPRDAVLALFAGKFIPRKRPMDLVRAIARCGEHNVHGLLVGDGELREACEAEARRLHARAHFTGFMNQSQLPTAYAAADVLVLPSSDESWGLVVNEAMACGRAAIVSRTVGCSPDLVRDGETGFTFDTGSVDQLASHLARLARDPSLTGRMGHAARAHIAQWSVSAAAAALIGTLTSASSRAGRRASA